MKIIDGKYYSDNGAELAEWLDVELSTTTALRQRKIIPPREDGKGYPVKESIRGYISYQRSKMQMGRPPSEKSSGEKSVKEQILEEKLRKDRRENDIAEGRLIEADVLVSIVNEIVGRIKPRLEIIPAQVVKFISVPRAGEIVGREIAKITDSIANIDIERMVRDLVEAQK